MKFNPDIHHRQSTRLKGYDYSKEGAYFVTFCVQNRECLFGNVVNGDVQLSTIGKIAHVFWLNIPKHFPFINLDEFIVMPNHLHGIVIIREQCRGVKFNAPTGPNKFYSEISPKRGSLPVIIRTYKTAVSHWCKKNGYGYFTWHRNYYEHIIRDEDDFNDIREYIINNPLKWEFDKENPKCRGV